MSGSLGNLSQSGLLPLLRTGHKHYGGEMNKILATLKSFEWGVIMAAGALMLAIGAAATSLVVALTVVILRAMGVL